jgi:hypothetical protein
MLKLLKKSALLIAIITASSCGTLPKKPEIEACAIIYEESVGFCINNITGAERDVPLPDMDKYVALSPQHWGDILVYVRKLESRLTNKKHKTRVKKEIQLVENMFKKLEAK